MYELVLNNTEENLYKTYKLAKFKNINLDESLLKYEQLTLEEEIKLNRANLCYIHNNDSEKIIIDYCKETFKDILVISSNSLKWNSLGFENVHRINCDLSVFDKKYEHIIIEPIDFYFNRYYKQKHYYAKTFHYMKEIKNKTVLIDVNKLYRNFNIEIFNKLNWNKRHHIINIYEYYWSGNLGLINRFINKPNSLEYFKLFGMFFNIV